MGDYSFEIPIRRWLITAAAIAVTLALVAFFVGRCSAQYNVEVTKQQPSPTN